MPNSVLISVFIVFFVLGCLPIIKVWRRLKDPIFDCIVYGGSAALIMTVFALMILSFFGR